MKNQKYYEKEILQIAIHGQAVAVHKDKLEPMVCAKEHCKDCLNCGTNGRCKDKEKTVILNWMEQEYIDPAERIDWSKIAIDTPILVRNDEDSIWERGYFAGIGKDGIFVYPNGTTNFTQSTREGKPVVYKHARLAKLPFNRGLFYQMYEQLLTLSADCQTNENSCNEDCSYYMNGECMYYRLHGFMEDNPDTLGDLETDLSTDLMMGA